MISCGLSNQQTTLPQEVGNVVPSLPEEQTTQQSTIEHTTQQPTMEETVGDPSFDIP